MHNFVKYPILQAPKCYENHLFAFLPPSFFQTKKGLSGNDSHKKGWCGSK